MSQFYSDGRVYVNSGQRVPPGFSGPFTLAYDEVTLTGVKAGDTVDFRPLFDTDEMCLQILFHVENLGSGGSFSIGTPDSPTLYVNDENGAEGSNFSNNIPSLLYTKPGKNHVFRFTRGTTDVTGSPKVRFFAFVAKVG